MGVILTTYPDPKMILQVVILHMDANFESIFSGDLGTTYPQLDPSAFAWNTSEVGISAFRPFFLLCFFWEFLENPRKLAICTQSVIQVFLLLKLT